jgi:outer membrane protein OmpA-like peptidoglycan-associated protein
MLRTIPTLVSLTAIALLGGMGCSKDKESEKSSPPVDANPTADPDFAVISVISVNIETKLAMMCGLSQSSVFFKFDSAKLTPDAKDRLDKIAKCATEGAIKDKEVVVVGRTDSVGTDEYNKQLGMSRADSVAKYLHEQGVQKARVDAVSKGEVEAVADPFGWPADRRVTVRLQP